MVNTVCVLRGTLKKKIDSVGRVSFLCLHFFYLELYHDYQIYLDFSQCFKRALLFSTFLCAYFSLLFSPEMFEVTKNYTFYSSLEASSLAL